MNEWKEIIIDGVESIIGDPGSANICKEYEI